MPLACSSLQNYGDPGGLSTTPLVMLPGYSSPASSRGSHSTHSHSSHSHSSSHSNQAFVSASAPGTPGSSGPIRDSGLQEAIERVSEQKVVPHLHAVTPRLPGITPTTVCLCWVEPVV